MSVEPPLKTAKTESPTLKLYYFDILGKGEPIRLALTYAGLEFEDYRFKDGEFAKMKEEGRLPFGQVPALEVDGKFLVQTNSILRYIGKIAGCYPDDPMEAAKIDMVMDQEHDLRMGVSCLNYQERNGFSVLGGRNGDNAQQVRKALVEEVLPRHLGNAEKLLQKTGWIAGTEKPTVADFLWATSVAELSRDLGLEEDQDLLRKYPALQSLVDRVNTLKEVRDWRESQNK